MAFVNFNNVTVTFPSIPVGQQGNGTLGPSAAPQFNDSGAADSAINVGMTVAVTDCNAQLFAEVPSGSYPQLQGGSGVAFCNIPLFPGTITITPQGNSFCLQATYSCQGSVYPYQSASGAIGKPPTQYNLSFTNLMAPVGGWPQGVNPPATISVTIQVQDTVVPPSN